MKKSLLKLIFLILAQSFLLSQRVCAVAYDVSTGLDILKGKVEVKKCCVINTPMKFGESDFDRVIGRAEYITISTLPDKSLGRLKSAAEI